MNKIEALQEEVIRLIGLQKNLLKQIREKIPTEETNSVATGGEVQDGKAVTGQFTLAAIDRKLKALDENLIKTQNLELVLAVVGTMKAGKSTCINAIVGQEILPNRNRPMTALPTLIRHKAGATTPVLHFGESRQGPVLALVKNMQKVLAKPMYPGRERIESDADLFALSKVISAQSKSAGGYTLKSRYEGEKGIFDFLKGLNDLVRLAKELGLSFPFEQYTSITDFPEIEVEFFHLREQVGDGTRGSFCLLDTPGFNEAGQAEYLLPMLKVQLEKATAVLAVLDYTQLKSESEAKLRDELESIAAYSGERMFCLVNKFDQNNSNSDSAVETRTYVAHNLLSKAFGPKVDAASRIYPVSGQHAYLAKRAEMKMAIDGSLGWQEGQPASWIDTFGKEALGVGYRRRINDPEEVREGARNLWDESRFDAPLTNVINYSHGNAARIAIQAATAKLDEIAGEDGDTARGIGAMLALRLQSMDLASEEIDALIATLKSRLDRLYRRKKSASDRLDELVREIGKNMSKSVKSVTSDMSKTITKAFNENIEKQKADAQAEAEAEAQERKPLLDGIFRKAEKKLTSTNPSAGGLMEFENRAEAKKCLDEIACSIKRYLEASADSLLDALRMSAFDFRNELKSLGEEIEKDIGQFEEHAAKVGLEGLKIRLPSVSAMHLELDVGDGGDSLVSYASYQKTRLRDRDSAGGAVKRFFGSIFGQADWGRDEYQFTVERYSFRKSDLEEHYRGVVADFNATLKDVLQRKFTEPMEANKNAFFATVSDAFDTIRESLNTSRSNQEESKERQEEIRTALRDLQSQYKESIDDIRHLKRNVTKLMSNGAQHG